MRSVDEFIIPAAPDAPNETPPPEAPPDPRTLLAQLDAAGRFLPGPGWFDNVAGHLTLLVRALRDPALGLSRNEQLGVAAIIRRLESQARGQGSLLRCCAFCWSAVIDDPPYRWPCPSCGIVNVRGHEDQHWFPGRERIAW